MDRVTFLQLLSFQTLNRSFFGSGKALRKVLGERVAKNLISFDQIFLDNYAAGGISKVILKGPGGELYGQLSFHLDFAGSDTVRGGCSRLSSGPRDGGVVEGGPVGVE